MGTRDPRVDAYIEKAAPFAQPILTHLRDVVHAACPECEEAMKWSMPHFMYKGMLAGMAAFKEHATFGFWKGALVLGADGKGVDDAMGQFGRLTSVKDLPSKKVLTGYVRQAMKLNDDGIKAPRLADRKPAGKAPVVAPDDLAAALKRNTKAGATFAAFPPGKQREYVEWITEAKTDATRQKRLVQAIEWMAEGKSRHWKYANC
jgi:uncharacterized protein YdeI (YjbR/CyaY-like superfamily)